LVISGNVTKVTVAPFDPPYPKKPMLNAHFTALRAIETQLLPI